MSTSAHNLPAPAAPSSVASFPERTVRPQGLGWTEDRVVLLTALWLEGLSAAAVARRMGGVSRNAVIGKVHRLGLSGRAAPPKPCRALAALPRSSRSPAGGRPPPLPRPPGAPSRVVTLAAGHGELVSLLQLSGARCRMPIGDPQVEGFGFCGAPARRGPYCATHGALAFQPRARGARRVAG